MPESHDEDLPASGAIRMMAFGVFEAEEDALTSLMSRASRWPGGGGFQEPRSPKLEQEQLVHNEFKALGWSLKIDRSRRGQEYILLGVFEQRGGFSTRTVIGRGTLQEICIAAVKYLDEGPGYREQLKRVHPRNTEEK